MEGVGYASPAADRLAEQEHLDSLYGEKGITMREAFCEWDGWCSRMGVFKDCPPVRALVAGDVYELGKPSAEVMLELCRIAEAAGPEGVSFHVDGGWEQLSLHWIWFSGYRWKIEGGCTQPGGWPRLIITAPQADLDVVCDAPGGRGSQTYQMAQREPRTLRPMAAL